MNVNLNVSIPLDDGHDVVVAGGGPSGCASALAAARRGMRVVLLEAGTCLGGMGTQGLVPCYAPFSDGEKIVYRGIAREIFDEVKRGMPHVKKEDTEWVAIDAERLKRVLDAKLTEAKVDVYFNAVVTAVEAESTAPERKKIHHVVAAHRGGLNAYGGSFFIDATGDSDLVALAEIPYRYGIEETGKIQPITQCFVLSNVSEYYYHSMPLLHMHNPKSVSYDIARSEKYPMVTDPHCVHKVLGPAAVGFNADHIWDVDPRDPKQVSKAFMQGRELAYEFHEGLKEYLPQVFGTSWLAQTTQMLGIRDSRRIIGDYTITLDDYLQRRNFPDEIGRNAYFLDRHLDIKQNERVMAGLSVGEDDWEHYKPGESHGIPYRALVVKDVDNILAPGRNVSCDHRTQGSIRTMPVCMVMGQAAGTAVSLAEKGQALRDLDVELLRKQLRQDGAYFI
jgi:hypothetical protein